jgi:hypothetical protein
VSTTRPPFSLLSVVANVERHNLASGEPWLLLMDLAWPGTDPITDTHARLVRNPDAVTFDANDGNGPQVYSPFNFQMGDLAVTSNGSVPDCEVVASNVLRALQQTIEQFAGVVGAALDLYVVNAANLLGEPDLALSFTVKQTTSDAKLVHFKLGASSPLRRLFPIHMYRPNFCIWQYNSPVLQAAAAAAIVSFTGNTTSGSTSVTSVSSTAGLSIGIAISGPGITAGTRISAIGSGTLTLSIAATATATAAALTAMTLKDPPGIQCGYKGVAITGDTTSGSATVSSISSMTGLVVGMVVLGPGIPVNTSILTLGSGTLTLSANATATATGAALTASLPTCDHTIDGANGCIVHNNLIRIGTFPGIDTNGAAVASVA